VNRKGSRVILGSRSPRRLELLKQIVPADLIEVVPPRSTEEAGFDALHDWPTIEARLEEIARAKSDDVLGQLADRRAAEQERTLVIAADTIVVVNAAGGRWQVLGQPPDDASWETTVRMWFRNYYAGKTHRVATALWVADAGREPKCRVVISEVTFYPDVDRWLDWYIATGESRGKAGGYAIQGAASIFVSRVEGSISNVIGLPLRELMELLPPNPKHEARMTKE
jgi:septum formation protein